MFHLFNKSYLEFDEVINSNYDRVVISEIKGVPLLDLYEQINIGELIHFEKNIDNISFRDLIQKIYDHSKSSNNKTIIYCDKINYCKFLLNVIVKFFYFELIILGIIVVYILLNALLIKSI